MSSIAKIFIVINFVLSILYMGIAGTLLAQKWDYRQLLIEGEQKHKEKLEDIQFEIEDSKTKLAQAKESLKQRIESATKNEIKAIELEQQNENYRRIISSFNETIANLRTDIKDINSKLNEKEGQIKSYIEERDKAKKEADEYRTQKESAKEERHELEVQLNNLQGQLAETEKILQTTQKELFETKTTIRSVKNNNGGVLNVGKSEKPVDGFVTAISNSGLPIIMLSVGKDDGVEKGYQFTVYRGSEYVGRVIVEDVYKDASACRINKEMTVKQIQKGDNATTRIGGNKN